MPNPLPTVKNLHPQPLSSPKAISFRRSFIKTPITSIDQTRRRRTTLIAPKKMIATIARILVRFLQFVLALTVAGVYAKCLTSQNVNQHEHCLFAVVVAGISAVTTLVYLIPFVKSFFAFAWDLVIFLLYLVIFGIFAKIYVGTNPNDAPKHLDTTLMTHAVWLDLVTTVFWLGTASHGCYEFLRWRKVKAFQRSKEAQIEEVTEA